MDQAVSFAVVSYDFDEHVVLGEAKTDQIIPEPRRTERMNAGGRRVAKWSQKGAHSKEALSSTATHGTRP